MCNKETLDEETLEKLANSKRFLKKNHLQKIDDIKNHLHTYSLDIKDEDLEYEWRLGEMKSRRFMALLCGISFLFGDFFWTFLLARVNFTGKAIKIVLDTLIITSYYQAFEVSQVKKTKTVTEILSQNNLDNYTKQEIIQLKLAQQRECQRQFFWFIIWWYLFILRFIANDHQIYFETYTEELSPEDQVVQENLNYFMVGINLMSVGLALLMLGIHWILMGLPYIFFCITSSFQVYKFLPNIFIDFVIVEIMMQCLIFGFGYKRIQFQKQSFLKSKKIQSLLKEQIEIFQQLPDGAIIHRTKINEDENDSQTRIVPNEQIEIEIRHLNDTFEKMFNTKRSVVKKNGPTNSTPFDSQADLEQNQQGQQIFQDNDYHGLDIIYLQKSPYKINGKMVEQIEDQPFSPIQFIDAIKDFESGQVYSVLNKDCDGNFHVLNQQAGGFLIYIVTQMILFNEEISTITYFKDITFGVLYEQVKAQQELETNISNALSHKMGIPLQTIIHNCQGFEDSPGDISKIQTTKMLAKLMMCQLEDMRDWKELKAGKFRKVSEKFLLSECLKEIYEMTSIKAKLKNLKLEFKLGGKFFPTWVIGDCMRFQKIAFNLTSNAVNNTTHGKISVSVTYHKQKQQIYFEVKDTGQGIKPKDQENFFKIFKDSKVGMGLIISREIVQKYNGKISFESEYLQGSKFAFTYDVENYSTEMFDEDGNLTMGTNLEQILEKIVGAQEVKNNEQKQKDGENQEESTQQKIFKSQDPSRAKELENLINSSLGLIKPADQDHEENQQEILQIQQILKSEEIELTGTEVMQLENDTNDLNINTQLAILDQIQHFKQKGNADISQNNKNN